MTDRVEGTGIGMDCFRGNPDISQSVYTADLLDRVGGNRDLLNQLIVIFLQDLPHILENIGTAVNSGDPDALQKHAHLLKGTLANLAAYVAVQHALRLEQIGLIGSMVGAQEELEQLRSELTRVKKALDLMAAYKD